MARKSREELLLNQADHYENILESLRNLPHIKHIHFNRLGEFFLFCREYQGRKYSRLGIAAVFMDDGFSNFAESEIASRNDEGKVTATYIAPADPNLEIVKTMTVKEASSHFEELLKQTKAAIEGTGESPRKNSRIKGTSKINN